MLKNLANLAKRTNRRIGIKYRIDFVRHYLSAFGVVGAMRMRRLLTTRHDNKQTRTVVLPGVKYPVKLRPGTADASTLESIFVWKQYGFPLPRGAKTILDCGANIGLASVWFAHACPDAKILAIEPEQQNYRLLEQNCGPYPNIRPLRGAIWNRSCELFLSSPDSRVDSYQFEEATNDASDPVRAYDLSTIMLSNDIDLIDVLKLDIEGAEAEVFTDNFTNWLGKTRMMIIEIHSDGARAKIDAAVAGMRWRRFKLGENDVFEREG